MKALSIIIGLVLLAPFALAADVIQDTNSIERIDSGVNQPLAGTAGCDTTPPNNIPPEWPTNGDGRMFPSGLTDICLERGDYLVSQGYEGFIIEGDGITVNCDGSTFINDDGTSTNPAIEIRGQNVEVLNCATEGFVNGILITNGGSGSTSKTLIHDNVIRDSSESGIVLVGETSWSPIMDTELYDNTVVNSPSSSILNKAGIEIDGYTQSVLIKKNTVHQSKYHGIFVDSNAATIDITVRENSIVGNAKDGIRSKTDNVIITANLLQDQSPNFSGGIKIAADSNQVLSNTLKNNYYGIQVESGSTNQIKTNYIESSRMEGIYDLGAGTIVQGNTVQDILAGTGIKIQGSGSSVTSNIICGNNNGVDITCVTQPTTSGGNSCDTASGCSSDPCDNPCPDCSNGVIWPAVPTGDQYLCGNINNEDQIDISDLTYLVSIFFDTGNTQGYVNYCAADVDGDGAVKYNSWQIGDPRPWDWSALGDLGVMVDFMFMGGETPTCGLS